MVLVGHYLLPLDWSGTNFLREEDFDVGMGLEGGLGMEEVEMVGTTSWVKSVGSEEVLSVAEVPVRPSSHHYPI